MQGNRVLEKMNPVDFHRTIYPSRKKMHVTKELPLSKSWDKTPTSHSEFEKANQRHYQEPVSRSGYSAFSPLDPKLVFSSEGLEFWGAGKTRLDYMVLKESDLIINCTGVSYERKPFVKSAPNWLQIDNSLAVVEQVILDWPDYGTPPASTGLEFWKSIVSQAKQFKKKRIICCCSAGRGRTGTALAAFLCATPPCALVGSGAAAQYIRTAYSKEAIEAKSQETYIEGLTRASSSFLEQKRTSHQEQAIPYLRGIEDEYITIELDP